MTWLLVWFCFAGPIWAAIGSTLVPSRYRRRGKDARQIGLVAGLAGASLGPIALAVLWLTTPPVAKAPAVIGLVLLVCAQALAFLAFLFPQNPCITSPGYDADLLQNGLILGAVYATMAVGLSLIFSVQNVINFAHGQFVMFGGIAAYFLLQTAASITPIGAIIIVGVAGFVLGVVIDRGLLDPIYRPGIERKDEFALLATFGLGVFLQYAILGALGPTSGVKVVGYTALLPSRWNVSSSMALGPLHIRLDTAIASVLGLILFGLLIWILRATWLGRSFRAVATNPAAAATAGIDSRKTSTYAFAMGTALAGMTGAILISAITFQVPDIGTEMGLRSYIIVVLGGLGSVPGALLGGLTVGVIEALGAGCYPDPSKGAAYQVAFSLAAFALVLLLRPSGFFGRRLT